MKTFVSRFRFFTARLPLLTIIAFFACFALPAAAQTQKAFWETDTSKIEFLSPQTNSRPDILWMRGGRYDARNSLDLLSVSDILRDSESAMLMDCPTVSFGAATNFAVGTLPDFVALGDFNSDSKLDMAVTNETSNNVSILLGTGDGNFSFSANFSVGIRPQSVALGDFNGDGKLDIAVPNQSSNNVSILIGTGTGSFGAATSFATASQPAFVATGDFNGDGKFDLAVPSFNTNQVSILLGTGTGGFGAVTNFAGGTGPKGITLSDLNGDGKLDLVLANNVGNISTLLGTGAGSFGSATNFTIGSDSFHVAAGDFNGDGKLDLAAANYSSASVSVLLNTVPCSAPTHTISGHIQRSNNAAISGVSVALSGSSVNNTITNATGDYSFTVVDGGSYTVTPTLSGNIFTPSSQNFNFILSNQTANFTAALNTFTISGNVQSDGANLQGATVILSGSRSNTTTTDANGDYSLTANQGGNYTVTAFKNGYAFTPANQTFNNLQANQTANFQNGALLCVPAPSGLTAWYKGENNGLDSSGNGNTGTLDGGLGFASGKIGQAFSFDGSDDRLRVSDNPNSAPTGTLTIDVWAKPAVTNSQRILVSKYDNSLDNGRSYYLSTDATGAKIQFTIYETPGTANTRRVETTAAVLTANVFTHIAATFDTATQVAHIYINGVDTPFTVY